MKSKKVEEKRMNNKGFTGYEILTVALVCLVLSYVVLQIALSTKDGERYSIFIYDAKLLGTNAVQLQMLDEVKSIYLSELVEKGYVTEMKNPFDGDKYCNMYESKVVFDENTRKVSLRCGNYLIKDHPLGEEKVEIYTVSNWMEGQGNKDEVSQILYNVKENNNYVYQNFIEEDLFIKSMNQKYQTKFTSVEAMKETIPVEEKVFHRKEKLVKEMTY